MRPNILVRLLRFALPEVVVAAVILWLAADGLAAYADYSKVADDLTYVPFAFSFGPWPFLLGVLMGSGFALLAWFKAERY